MNLDLGIDMDFKVELKIYDTQANLYLNKSYSRSYRGLKQRESGHDLIGSMVICKDISLELKPQVGHFQQKEI